MMQSLRESTKVVFYVVIFFFVISMFFLWGMDMGPGGLNGNAPNAVATVNGEPISYDDWRNSTSQLVDQMRGDGSAVGESQRLRAEQQAFDQLVDYALLRQAAEKEGISTSSEEIIDRLQNNPPQDILAFFTTPEGEIDYDGYYSALQNPDLSATWSSIESQMRQNLPIEKLNQQIAGQAVVGEAELRAAFAEQTIRGVVEYMGRELSTIELPEGFTPPAEEVEAWYRDHLREYALPPRATVRYATLPKVASEEDRSEIISILEEYKAEILDDRMTFEEAASTISEDPSAAQGGDLGFFDRQRMVAPFTEAAFALPIGAMSDPVVTQFGVHLIKVEDEKVVDGERTEIKARHILLKLYPGADTLEELETKADQFREKADSDGFDAAVSEFGLAAETSAPFQEGMNIPGIPNSLPGSNFAFAQESGTVSPVFNNEETFYILEIGDRIEAGHRPLEEVRTLIESSVTREHRIKRATAEMQVAWDAFKGGQSMEAAAEANNLDHATTDSFTVRDNIPGIGFATSFARAALELEPGQEVFPVVTRRGVYGLRLLHKDEFDETAFAQQRAGLHQSMLFSKQRRVLDEWMKEMRTKAEIVDRRADFR